MRNQMSDTGTPTVTEPIADTFAETALKLGGKSEEEARKTGAIDRADDQVEALFAPRYQTSGSPVHRAVWDDPLPISLFTPTEPKVTAVAREAMNLSLNVIRRHKAAGTIRTEQGKITEQVISELGQAGYWGLLIDRHYGGHGVSFGAFSRLVTEMATVDPTVAGLASVHGCIGAVDPLLAFGSEQQKQRFLPKLASGERVSAFALTEPGAGSDLTALRTTALANGDSYIVNGEKIFITNAVPGRTIGLVCLIENNPAVLLIDLPDKESEQFQTVRYGLYALKHAFNNGLRFHNFKVPKENLLEVPRGDGLTVAYHGLNRGRVALCANAAGNMRVMLANILPWARYRKTYGGAIETRELVQYRIGRLSGLIVASDALSDWCAWLLDQGYRGEMECIIAKIFGSEAQKEAAIELFMKTHGGRSFLHGHLFGDNVHEFLAPCIYEGEGEMLGLALFKSLVKMHGRTFFEPIGKALAKAGIRRPNPANPLHLWAMRKALLPYANWKLQQCLPIERPALPQLPPVLAKHARFATKALRRSRGEIDTLMNKHQLHLPDRQCVMAAQSKRIQNAVVMLVTAIWAGNRDDSVVQEAANVICMDLRHQLTGHRNDSVYYREVTQLGHRITEGGFKAIAGVDAEQILMPY